MKKILAFIAMICFVGAGFWYVNQSDSTQSSDQDSVWYTSSDIVDILESNGIALEKNQNYDVVDFSMGEVEPTVYNFKGLDDSLWIYVFSDIDERDDIMSDTSIVASIFPDGISMLQTRNIVILQDGTFDKDLIYNTINYTLNGASNRIYSYDSEDWHLAYTLEYYNNEIVNSVGEMYLDQYANAYYNVWYIGDLDDTENVPFDIEFNSITGIRSEQRNLDSVAGDDYFILGSSIEYTNLDFDDSVTCTINWAGTEENVVLTMSE